MRQIINDRVLERIKDLGWNISMFYTMAGLGEFPYNGQDRYSNEEWEEIIGYTAYLLNCSKDYLTNSECIDFGLSVAVNITYGDMFNFSDYIETIKSHFSRINYDNILTAGEKSGIPMRVYIDIVFGKILINRNTANKLDDYLLRELNIDRILLMSAIKNNDTFDKISDLVDGITDLKTLDRIIDICNKRKEKINENKNEI